jgi:putative transcriptional regulator
VVLLLAHEEEGSFGLVVNARTEVTMRDLMEELGLSWGGDPELRVHFGGPVESHLGSVLFAADAGEPLPELSHCWQPLPGIFLTQDRDELARLAARPPQRLRVLLGYAGWGPGQLLNEICRNDWLLAPPNASLIFSDDPESTWEQAVRSVGVEPSQLPVWTLPARSGEAN